MYNTETKQQGEWVTVEGMEFLELNDGAYIKKENVGDEWVEFDSQTVHMLEELIQKVKSGDEGTHFLLMNDSDEESQMLGYRLSNMMMLSFIEVLVQQFTKGDQINAMLLMMAIKDALDGGDDE